MASEIRQQSPVDRVAVLGQHVPERVRGVLGAYAVGSLVASGGKCAWAKARDLTTYQVTVRGDDDIYEDLHAWLIARLPARRQRRLTARSFRGDAGAGYVEESPGVLRRERKQGGVRFLHAGSRTERVEVGGFRVQVWIERESVNGPTKGGRSDDDAPFLRSLEKMVLSVTGLAARDAVMAMLVGLAQARAGAGQRFYIASRWGDWINRSDLGRRDLGTVVLAPGVKERLVADLERFLASEAGYERLGVPWHRGFLLHGPPGTGKTSLARALANRFALDVYYLPLSDLTADTNLLNLVTGVPARALLLIEDVDVVHGARSRDDAETAGVTLSGLLNALDGVATPHGLVTVMTTNDLAVLDPALLRPGRADVVQELGPLGRDDAPALVEALTGRRPRLPGLTQDATAAELVEVLLEHMHEPTAAQDAALLSWVQERNARGMVARAR